MARSPGRRPWETRGRPITHEQLADVMDMLQASMSPQTSPRLPRRGAAQPQISPHLSPRMDGRAPVSSSDPSWGTRSMHLPVEHQQRTPAAEFVEITDMSELALLAQMHSGQRMKCDEISFDKAVEGIMWAHDISKRGPQGTGERPWILPWGKMSCAFCALVFIILTLTLLLLITRATFREVSVSDGVLLARTVPAFSGEEPVAATASFLEYRNLYSCATLPATTLQNIRDIVIIHQGSWRCLRVTHVVKFSDQHVWFEAADGTGVRLDTGQVFFRDGMLGDEEFVQSNRQSQPLYMNIENITEADMQDGVIAYFDVNLVSS